MSDTEYTGNETATTTASRTNGCVKWFNNRQGYGFLTVSDGDRVGEDVFVHHTALDVQKEQYRYLVQGEYVEFDLAEMTEGEHKFQAAGVRGIHGGRLMCETRNASRDENQASGRRDKRSNSGYDKPSNHARGKGPRGTVEESDGTEWRLVQVKRSENKRHGRRPSRPMEN